MNKLVNNINAFLYKDFIFAPRYRVWRHVIYWSFHVIAWALFWVIMDSPASFLRNLFNMSLWVPVFILFGYPLVYIAIPKLLLRGKLWQFVLLILAWGAFGLYLNFAYRSYIYIPLQEAIGFTFIPSTGLQAHSYLCMTTSAASPMIIRFFKLCTIKQHAWMQAQQEKITAELQLLKAQVHPHFLFNTLNNIYAFSLEKSSKTPGLVLKLSSLLNYMLNDCKTDEVLLEKEIEILKNYVGLEKERYGSRIDISLNIQGDVQNKWIAPFLILPFIENAFKHGTSEQLNRVWLSIDIAVKDNELMCKIANSKNQVNGVNNHGIGVQNVQKRLSFLYPGKHRIKLSDEGDFFVVSLWLKLGSQTIISYHAAPVPATGYQNALG